MLKPRTEFKKIGNRTGIRRDNETRNLTKGYKGYEAVASHDHSRPEDIRHKEEEEEIRVYRQREERQ